MPWFKLIAFSERSIFQNSLSLCPTLLTNLFWKTDLVQRPPLWDLPSFLLSEMPYKTVTTQRAGPFVNILTTLPITRPPSVWNKGLLSEWGPVIVSPERSYLKYVKCTKLKCVIIPKRADRTAADLSVEPKVLPSKFHLRCCPVSVPWLVKGSQWDGGTEEAGTLLPSTCCFGNSKPYSFPQQWS